MSTNKPYFDFSKPIVIVGFGRTGKSFNQYLLSKDLKPKKDFYIFDDNESLANISLSEILKDIYTQFFISPGYSLSKSWILEKRKKNVIFLGELSFWAEELNKYKTISVTGSVGKSTLVKLISYCLTKLGIDNKLIGNIGTPVTDYFLSCDKEYSDVLVLELSSYQLELIGDFKSKYSILTKIIPNHLDRYKDFKHYYLTKLKLLFSTIKTNFLIEENLEFIPEEIEFEVIKKLAGNNHPQINSDCFSLCVSLLRKFEFGDEEIIKSMSGFESLPHRLEPIKFNNKYIAINDSKATTVEGVNFALKYCQNNFSDKKNIWLLLGGRNKGHDWSNLRISKYKNIKLVVFGSSKNKLEQEFKKNIVGSYDSLSKCLAATLKLVDFNTDLLLLSPGGDSFDEFDNFEKRGEFFKQEISKFLV